MKLISIAVVFPLLGRRGLRWCGRLIERALRLDEINRIHVATAHEREPAAFLRAVLEEFGVRCEVEAEDLLRIPAQGPVVVVSNHPFGGLDAIVLAAVLARVRADTKMLANHLLGHIPQMRAFIVPVDPFGGLAAARRNVLGMQRALAHLEAGGLLGVFPSGAVSHFQWRRLAVEDPPWSTHLHRLVRRTGATVVPVFFPGRNSLLFQVAGLVHPLLRTALIPREAVRRRGSTVRLVVGRPIPHARLARFDEAARFTRFIRMQTHVLAGVATRAVRGGAPDAEPVAPPEEVGALAAEVAALPAIDVLVREGEFLVAITRAEKSPVLVREIGRLREETFRAAGEGTGRARDLDRFDGHYVHLVLWDGAARRVAGAYRLARVDETILERGTAGLYTASLFRFQPGFLEQLGPALELGRSWVRVEYQRKHSALALLWRGILAWIGRTPECCLLLGAVSISRDYHPLSRGLIVSFLKHTRLDRRLAAFVRASRPYRLRGRTAQLARDVGDAVQSIDEVSLLVSEIEADGKGVPLLFRHYLRFHTTVLSFNVDPAFADVVDGLMLTDLRQTDPALLRRFMGADGYARFVAHHASVGTGPFAGITRRD